jgi:putative oxidoreductase
MKIASLVARLLLGVVFVVFGLNGFLHFIKAPMPEGIAGHLPEPFSVRSITW